MVNIRQKLPICLKDGKNKKTAMNRHAFFYSSVFVYRSRVLYSDKGETKEMTDVLCITEK